MSRPVPLYPDDLSHHNCSIYRRRVQQAESAAFLGCFDALVDPRQRGKVIYPLDEVLLLRLLATLAGAETFVDIALFGEKKRKLLRRFLPFAAGTPSHDHLGDLFATLDAECFQRSFAAWMARFSELPEGVVAIDGKTSRQAKKGGKAILHTVSAFAARQRLVLGQTRVTEKSNEITAIPRLLAMAIRAPCMKMWNGLRNRKRPRTSRVPK